MAEIVTPKEKVINLRNRISAIKDLLPPNYKMIIATRWPDYDSMKGAGLLLNVVTLRSTDEELTKILETIALEHQAKLQDEKKI
jgi:hypothetical protein